MRIEGCDVARWAPDIHVSDNVQPSAALETYRHRAPARYHAPDILFSDPQPGLIAGDRFSLVTERDGLVPGSIYLDGEYDWMALFGSAPRPHPLPEGPLLLAGNRAWRNYYHWTLQCLAAIAVAKAHGLAPIRLVVPPLDPVRRDALGLLGVEPAEIVELPAAAMGLSRTIAHTNLTTGDFAFVPHPAITSAFNTLPRVARSPHAGSRIYLARFDSASRRMENEAELVERLAGLGYQPVVASTLDLSQQIALFRDAAVIIAPHGAGLTNLIYAPDVGGPAIIELLQENYLHQAFLKLGQAKRLRYTAIVNRHASAAGGPHESTWTADIDLIVRVAAAL